MSFEASRSESLCPVAATAELVGGKWTLLVIRDLGGGPRRFCELERSLAGISPRTLSLRLRGLEDEGILTRQTRTGDSPHVEYVLTGKGQALLPLVEDMRRYGQAWLCEESASTSTSSGESTGEGRPAVALA